MAVNIQGDNSAASPGITGGDTDTGVRMGTNELSLVTNGTNRVNVDSSGNVGIGTTSPGSLFELNAAAGTTAGISFGSVGDSITASRYIGICNATDQTDISTNSGFSGIELGGPSSTNEGYLAFHTHDIGVASGERMRIDKSGNVGIGTTSPDALLNISVTGAANGSTTDTLILNNDNTNTGDDLTTRLRFSRSGNSATNVYTALDSIRTGTHDTDFSIKLNFGGSLKEWLRIKSEGKIIVGSDGGGYTVDYGGMFTVVGDADGTYTSIGRNTDQTNQMTMRNGAGSSSFTHIGFLNTTGQRGSIVTNGSSTTYNTTSDYRIKENVVTLTGAIDRVKQLAPKRFNFTGETVVVDGFLAHEAQIVVPEAITGEKDAVDANDEPVLQGIDQSKLVPLLTAALQEAIVKIEILETKVAALEGGK